MIINLIGSCDKRPVLFTVMKICQTLGDVLLVTSDSRLVRLSDTGATYGHYQNTMIAITDDGIDEFWSTFKYTDDDFDYIIIDNIVSADADVVIYVKGMTQSQFEEDTLEYIEDYSTIELFKNKLLDSNTLRNCEEFEALADMCPISAGVSDQVAKILGKVFGKDPKRLAEIAKKPTSTKMVKAPTVKSTKKSANINFRKR